MLKPITLTVYIAVLAGGLLALVGKVAALAGALSLAERLP